MSAFERWSLHLAAWTTAGSGLLYGWLRYFGRRAGEFGPEPHPWQAALQHLHVLAGPLLVLALGAVLKGHVQPLVRDGRVRAGSSGALLLAGLAPMVLGGYAVQVCSGPAWRSAWAWVHGLGSLVFLGAYLVHLARGPQPATSVVMRPEGG